MTEETLQKAVAFDNQRKHLAELIAELEDGSAVLSINDDPLILSEIGEHVKQEVYSLIAARAEEGIEFINQQIKLL